MKNRRFFACRPTGWQHIILAFYLTSQVAAAENGHPAHPDDGREVVYLSLDDALKRGATSGPDVVYAMAPQAAAGEAVKHSSPVLSQVPVLQGQLGPRISSGRTSPEVIVSLSQGLPLTNTTKAQHSLAQAERTSVNTNVELAALDSAERAGHAWIDLAYAEELLVLRKDAAEQAELHLEIVKSRVESGAVDSSDLALAESELAAAQSLVLEAEGQHFLAAQELGFVIGLEDKERADVKNGLSQVAIMEATGPRNDLGEHPSIVAAEARAEASRQAISYAKTQQVPNISLGVQYQREGTGDQIITGMFSVPLPLWKPWRFQEARARVQYDQDLAGAKLAEQTLAREIEKALHERSHATAQYELLKQRAIPPRKEALRIARAKFQAGEIDFLRVSWAQRELLQAQQQLAMALSDLHRAHLHLLRCTGALKEKIK